MTNASDGYTEVNCATWQRQGTSVHLESSVSQNSETPAEKLVLLFGFGLV